MHNNRPYESHVKRIQQTKSLHEEYPPKSFCDNDYPDPIVTEVIETEYEIFNGTFIFMKEKELFPTKEELVASLLK